MNTTDDNPILGAFLSKNGRLKVTSKDFLIGSNIAYLGTAWFTNVSPLAGAAFITLTFLVSHTVRPLISSWLDPYNDLSFIHATSKTINIVVSALTAKSICYAIGYQITFKQIAQVTAAFLVCVTILKYAIINLAHLPS